MRPVGPGAGSRRGVLKAAAGLLAALCTGCAAAIGHGGDAILEPLFSITGARIITRMDVAGGAMPGAIGPHVPLVFPVAVASSFNDIYIADAGATRLYRYDRTLDVMAVMPTVRISPGTRLQAGPDGSIYILDTFTSEIHRYTRGGQPLPSLRPRLATSRYSDFVVDAATGKSYALDSAHRVVDEIQPMGGIALDVQRLEESGPLATDGRGLFVASASCGCVIEWIHGRQGRRFGAGKLRLPLSIAVDGPHMFVLDGFDRSVARVHEDGIETQSAADLDMRMPESLSAAQGMILIADGAGRQVTAFRHGSRRPR